MIIVMSRNATSRKSTMLKKNYRDWGSKHILSSGK